MGGCRVYGDSDVPSCQHSKTWDQANSQCKKNGRRRARLCSKSELQSRCATGTGCQHDYDMIWSGTAGPAPTRSPTKFPTVNMEAINKAAERSEKSVKESSSKAAERASKQEKAGKESAAKVVERANKEKSTKERNTKESVNKEKSTKEKAAKVAAEKAEKTNKEKDTKERNTKESVNKEKSSSSKAAERASKQEK